MLSDGDEPLLACVVANAAGYAELDGLPLLTAADPADGRVEVAVAVPVVARSRLRPAPDADRGPPGARPGGRPSRRATASYRTWTTGSPAR